MPNIKIWCGVVTAALLAGLLAGCSTQARRVDCEGRLRPINAPAPVATPTPTPTTTTNGRIP